MEVAESPSLLQMQGMWSGVPMSGHCVLLKGSYTGLSFLRANILMVKRELILVTRNEKNSVSLISQKSSSVQATQLYEYLACDIFFTITYTNNWQEMASYRIATKSSVHHECTRKTSNLGGLGSSSMSFLDSVWY